MKHLMKLRINREGEFIALGDVDHPYQCGTNGVRHYQYFVMVEATNEKLSPEGFVLDNEIVDRYFQETYGTIDGHPPLRKCDSCENMAQEAVEYFLNLFQNSSALRGIDLRRVLVRLHGSNHSFIEAEWKQ